MSGGRGEQPVPLAVVAVAVAVPAGSAVPGAVVAVTGAASGAA